jgi:hypothetical protein
MGGKTAGKPLIPRTLRRNYPGSKELRSGADGGRLRVGSDEWRAISIVASGWGNYARFWKYKSPVLMGVLGSLRGAGGLTCFLRGWREASRGGGDGVGGVEEGRLVVAPAASLRPSAEWNPLIREKPRMNGAPGVSGEQRNYSRDADLSGAITALISREVNAC